MTNEEGERLLNHNFEHWFEPVDEYRRPDSNGGYFYFKHTIRYFLSHGGRGGGKSEFVAECLIILASQFKIKILCAREFQNSIDDSVLSLLERKIKEMEASGELSVGEFVIKNNRIYGANGSLFTFIGLARNIGSIKSYDDYDILWIEEGQYISARAWELLDPTIRKSGSVVIVSMNRDCEDACLDRQFIQQEPSEDSIVTKVNYYHNPYDIPVLVKMAEECKRKNPDAYQHIWEGELNNLADAQVLHGRWRIGNFVTPKGVTFYHGADWSNGGADPHTLIRSFINGNKLYIDYELKTNAGGKNLPALWRTCDTLESCYPTHDELDGRWVVYCDEARPDLIKDMCDAGFNAVKANKKFKGTHEGGSIRAGIKYLRSFDEIVIHERCVETIKEAKYWKWKIDDRSGDVTAELAKGNDHLMDALRYAHWKIISARKEGEAISYG